MDAEGVNWEGWGAVGTYLLHDGVQIHLLLDHEVSTEAEGCCVATEHDGLCESKRQSKQLGPFNGESTAKN